MPHEPYTGSAYLFDVTTGNQIGKLTASDAAQNDRFGVSVATSESTVIVGAYGGSTGTSAGAAYLFIPEPTTLTLAALGLMGCAVRRRKG